MLTLNIFITGQGQMLLLANQMGVHWNFQFAVKIADNRDYIVKIHLQRNEQHNQNINCTVYHWILWLKKNIS